MKIFYRFRTPFLSFVLVLVCSLTHAQTDACAGATALTVGTSCVTTAYSIPAAFTNNATEAPNPCSGTSHRDAWYTFTTDATTTNVVITGTSNRELGLAVYSGTCGSGTLVQIACTVPNTADATLTAAVLPNTTYRLRMMRTNNANSNAMSGNICVYKFVPLANDNCSGATPLTVNPATTCTTTTSGTTVGATQSIPALTCSGYTGTADDDVWYSFVATGTVHTITVVSTFDAVVDVRSGACNGANINCADTTSGAGTETVVASGLTSGLTYYVRVYSWGSAVYGTFTVCVTTPPPPPANDNCSGATGLTVNSGTTCSITTSGTSINATQSQASCAGTADDDVWYSFVATATAHTVTVTPGTMSDAVFQVFSGTCAGTLTSLACSDATSGTAAETATISGLTIGATYYVRTHSYGSGTGQGTFTICVTTPTLAVNDNCSGAIGLAVNPNLTCTTSTSSTTIGATQSYAGCYGTADDDVWFSFVATSTSHNITVAPGTLYDAVFQIFSGTCAGTLTSLGCIDNTVGTANETTALNGLTVGATYYVRVYSYYGLAGDRGTFTICVTTPVPLTNDNCATAGTLTVNASTACSVTTVGTTVGASQSLAGCSGTADDDVWYTFVATNNTHNITVTPGTLYDAVFQVFSGSCAGLTSIKCVDDTIGTSVESATLTGLTVGVTYYVRIYSYYGLAADRGTFTVCVTTEVPCSAGSSTGTTDLGCPNVVSGGLGLNGSDPLPISCTSAGCVDLEATYLHLGTPTSYTVQPITYAPPYQFGCLANPVSVNNDDIWSPVITLPFNFCFYGNTYNQCVMSSNGVISFDTTNNTPGGWSEWEILNNVPNANLFPNSIFGVYHDIDPRVGGEVGWELITLNTGCRALVASWKDIPMYSTTCNSQLYTGMIVLYENTNIIDVFIEQKNVCGSWNDGNAIVGMQNATGTAGIAAPNRNGLDANWTVTNEAWRFVPSGTSITSLKWYEGAGTSGPMIGTSDTINVCPIATTVYTAEVTYTLCNGTLLKETESTTVNVSLSKVWNGSVNTDWNTPNNWTPAGVPTNLDCVIVPNVANDPIISGSAYDAYAYTLRVLTGGLLTLNPNNNLTVTNIVNVNAGGTFNIKDDGSLLQIDNIANTGSINMERITPPVYRFDYTYWNSPVTMASNYTLGMLSQNLTQYDKYYHWTPSVSNGTGIWVQESVATIMDPTKGYIVRAPNSYSFTPTVFTPYTANFIGTPNNGNIDCPITYGTLGAASLNDKWNLIGNPYPCAVSASAFTAANSSVINGTLYFWTHNSAISPSFPDPFYNDFVLNYTSSDYASWNSTGGTAASSGGTAPNGYIAAAQSFFVQSKAVPGNATFTNAMRVKNNNAQFYRMTNAGPENGDGGVPLEKHRIWLNMTNNLNAFNQLLVGYVETATNGWDSAFDGDNMNQSNIAFYSVIPGKQLVIQGRALPFDVNDKVPLGYTSTIAGDFSIRIDHFDGLFQNQNIYVEDKWLHVIHNLKESPYNFIAGIGTFNDRFVLRYTNPALAIGNHHTVGSLHAFIRDEMLFVKCPQNISAIEIYDAAGKCIKTYTPQKSATEFSDAFHFPQSFYIAKVRMADGSTGNAKLAN